VPELPDIAAYISALEPRIIGQPLKRVRLASPFLLRTAEPPIASAEGGFVRELRRIGKRIVIGVEGDLWLVLHLMIAGRLHWRTPEAKLAGRQSLAAFDFPKGSLVLTEAGTSHRASLHVVAREEELRSIDPGGIEIFASDLSSFREALVAENRTLKRALTDPRIVSGIGNAYSDEILHAAQLSPIRLTHKLEPQEWERLFAATRDTLEFWIGAEIFPKQRLCRSSSETDQHPRLNSINFREKPRLAGTDLGGSRRLMNATFPSRNPLKMFDHFGDIHLVAIYASFLQSAVKKKPRRAHERVARNVFSVARLFAYKHHLRTRRTLAENGLSRVSPQIASFAIGRNLTELINAGIWWDKICGSAFLGSWFARQLFRLSFFKHR
jgi:formamidopyrimidine-DNA glycosylase